MTPELLNKIEVLTGLINTYSHHALISGEGSTQDHFKEEALQATKEIEKILS